MRNFKLTVCYDGTGYRGWQKQGNTTNTIQARLETLLSRLLGQTVEVAGSGRTDAGVHARAQVCSFRADTALGCDALLEAIRNYLPEDIGAVSLEVMPPRFHARLSCREKTYVYRIHTGPGPNVFRRRYMWTFDSPLSTVEMERAAALLCGTHDFSAFTTNKSRNKSAVRTLRSVRIESIPEEEELRFVFVGDGFLYNMVRILVGTLLEVGTGQRSVDGIPLLLESSRRSDAGFTAPAKGLTLCAVRYDTEPLEERV